MLTEKGTCTRSEDILGPPVTDYFSTISVQHVRMAELMFMMNAKFERKGIHGGASNNACGHKTSAVQGHVQCAAAEKRTCNVLIGRLHSPTVLAAKLPALPPACNKHVTSCRESAQLPLSRPTHNHAIACGAG